MPENPRAPVETLTAEESARVRALVHKHGATDAAKLLGGLNERTLLKAGCGVPIARLTAQVLRARLATYRAQISPASHSTRTA